MTLLLAVTLGVVAGASVYLLLTKELKSIAMGVFLLSHVANLAILMMSRSPLNLRPPVLGEGGVSVLDAAGNPTEADPLPQALVLTAIVIGLALQAFLLTLLVVTWRRTKSLNVLQLAGKPGPADAETVGNMTPGYLPPGQMPPVQSANHSAAPQSSR
ncbi:MAG: NADH-quinone oxidoreductase subunit K [Planctomycetota bacterium]